MKKNYLVKRISFLFSTFIVRVLVSLKPAGLFIIQSFNQALRQFSIKVNHGDINMEFKSPNYLIYKRIKSFSTKEPITLSWIDSIPKGSVLYDIGANIGLYSIYAAKKGINVYSFEPSVMNIREICENVALNEALNVVVIPLPLSDQMEISQLSIGDNLEGASQSSFKYNVSQTGEIATKIFSYGILSFSVDKLVELNILARPDYIKLDVDGIEDRILFGAINTLKSVKSIIVEVNENWEEQFNKIDKLFKDLGFIIVDEGKLGGVGMKNIIWKNGMLSN